MKYDPDLRANGRAFGALRSVRAAKGSAEAFCDALLSVLRKNGFNPVFALSGPVWYVQCPGISPDLLSVAVGIAQNGSRFSGQFVQGGDVVAVLLLGDGLEGFRPRPDPDKD